MAKAGGRVGVAGGAHFQLNCNLRSYKIAIDVTARSVRSKGVSCVCLFMCLCVGVYVCVCVSIGCYLRLFLKCTLQLATAHVTAISIISSDKAS